MGPPTGQSHHQRQPLAQQTQGTQLQLHTQGGIQMQSGTCWRFQSAKGCDGTCLWPHTHQCYSCGRDHSTRLCPLGDTHPGPNSTQTLPPLPFPALEGRVPERSTGAPDRDYRSATTGMTRGGSPSKRSGQLLATRHDITPPGGCSGGIWEGGKTSSRLTDDLRDEDWQKVQLHQRTTVKFATMGTMHAEAGYDAACTHYLVEGFR